MNKKEFLEYFKNDDEILLSKLYDKILLHEKISKPIYLNEFYSPLIWSKLLSLSSKLGCNIGAFGIFKESDRRVISILGAYDHEEIYNYPIELIRIDNKSTFKKLKHSDFLGALMAQGLKREKFGDLIVKGDSCYVPICSDISQFIIDNVTQIGKNPCSIKIINHYDGNEVPTFQFQEKSVVISSMRLDSIVAALSGLSRGNSEDLIKKGLVLINYDKITKRNAIVKPNSIITIRGYGKFRIDEYIGKTLKGRERIIIKKYI